MATTTERRVRLLFGIQGLLLAALLAGLAAPAAAGDGAVVAAAHTSGQDQGAVVPTSYTVGESGHAFKWKPYRPKTPVGTESRPVQTAQYTVPAETPSGLHPLDDPFGEAAPLAVEPALPSVDQLIADDNDAGGAVPDLLKRQLEEDRPSLKPFEDETDIGPLVQAPRGTTEECKYAPDDILRPIQDLDHQTQIRLDQKLAPKICDLEGGQFLPRAWAPTTFMWKASGLCHKPAYFEDVHLERYGHSWGPYIQPIMSGAHFFLNVPIIPYKMGLYPPGECIYTLGYYRPGNCAPYMLDPLPLSVRAGLAQAGAVVGFSAFLP